MSRDEGNRKKDELLGEPHGTAANRLRKMLLFKYVQLAGHDICHRCEGKIYRVEDLSVEHKTPWQSAKDPKETFFDTNDIAFSHLVCNVAAADRSVNYNSVKTHCKRGHEFTLENTGTNQRGNRLCRQCWTINKRDWRDKNGHEHYRNQRVAK